MNFLPFSILFIIIIASKNYAVDYKWNYAVDANVTLALNTFSDNWSGKNAGTFMWVSRLNSTAKRNLTDHILSESCLKLTFGQTSIQDKDSKKWSSPEKSSDNINLTSTLRFKPDKFAGPYISFNVNSQFFDNRFDTLKTVFNPLELSESFGFAHSLIKKKNLTFDIHLGGAMRQYVDFNVPVTDSIGPQRTTTNFIYDDGAELISEFKYRKGDYLKFSSKLHIFKAFMSTNHTKTFKKKYWQTPDLNWENSVIINVTKNIVLNYYININYDKDIDFSPRIKQTLGAGLNICFRNQ
jgi:hypothetical protein